MSKDLFENIIFILYELLYESEQLLNNYGGVLQQT